MRSKRTIDSAMLPVVTAFSSQPVLAKKFMENPTPLSGVGTHTRPLSKSEPEDSPQRLVVGKARREPVSGGRSAIREMVPVLAAATRPPANAQRPLACAIFMIVAGLMTTSAAAHATGLASDPPTAAATGKAIPPATDSAPRPAATGSAAKPVKQPEVKRLKAVEVTGSLIKVHSRSEVSSSPLATIDIDQIAAAGQISLDSAIGRMPQFAAAQGQSEVGDVQGATGFQGGQSYADLRGLGAERTLVLLDGQRLVPTNPNGAVDLNLIPMALLKDVDVITGGASATYGSDAVAGVVNFRLRQHFQGIQLSAQTGGAPRAVARKTAPASSWAATLRKTRATRSSTSSTTSATRSPVRIAPSFPTTRTSTEPYRVHRKVSSAPASLVETFRFLRSTPSWPATLARNRSRAPATTVATSV
ncbi:hypothetical protein CS053_10130 [Rhodanobacter glycinis]|uniref:TonB-dependent receptor plug domain-containing protein n=1 Tax=Rhodanobacter glycinis TaxID=582702 RepID=A0A5B9E3N1_9GAMM|nr:hypothetical protein CS053_10130 [Rhodanobacter glycinis]